MGTMEWLTAILAFITAIYAWLTHKIAQSTENSLNTLREQNEALMRPYITVTLRENPNDDFIELKIKNTGKTSARNLTLSIDKDFLRYDGQDNLRNLSIFTKNIDGYPPDHELTFELATGTDLFSNNRDPAKQPLSFCITARYEYFGKTIEEKHPIDLHPYEWSKRQEYLG